MTREGRRNLCGRMNAHKLNRSSTCYSQSTRSRTNTYAKVLTTECQDNPLDMYHLFPYRVIAHSYLTPVDDQLTPENDVCLFMTEKQAAKRDIQPTQMLDQ